MLYRAKQKSKFTIRIKIKKEKYADLKIIKCTQD
jgi:hypothetical protein